MGMAVARPELGFQWEHDDSIPRASAASSPIRLTFSSQLPGFYSAPSSPMRGLATLAASRYAEADQLDTSRRTKIINHDTIIFEFETSRRTASESQLDFQQQLPHGLGDDPTMAYADQLFKNGKVLPSTPPATPRPQLHVGGNRSFSVPLSQKQGRGEDFRGTYFLDGEISGGSQHPPKDPNSPPPSPQNFRPERSEVAAPAADHLVPTSGERVERPSLETTKSLRDTYKQRSVKNLFLFRSASHGRAQPKDTLREPTAAIWEADRDAAYYSNETQFKGKKKKKKKKKVIKEKEKEKEMRKAKKTGVQRPGLLLCFSK